MSLELTFCAKFWGLKYLQVLGDSQVIINWDLGEAQVKSLELIHLLVTTIILMKDFTGLTFNHVYMELNAEANTLSKLVLGVMDGRLHYSLIFVGSIVRLSHLIFF